MQNADAVEGTHSAALPERVGNSQTLAQRLEEAGEWLADLGPDFQADRRRLDESRQRLLESRCHLAVVGQFKRGKSTLINALLGAPVLPAAVVPLTSIPTFLHPGDDPTACVVFDDHQPQQHFRAPDAGALAEFLAQYVTESGNPHNRLGVCHVDVTYPALLLSQGMALIDTPGIGSTFRHNTEATMNLLPRCDAALFVVSADPAITEVEVEFLKLARQRLARLFFVLNKTDYLDEGERRSAVAFLGRVLCEQADFAEPPPILCVSARRGLEARQAGDAVAWRESGLADLERCIVDFLVRDKADVLCRAVARQADDALLEVGRRLELMLRSLVLPLDVLKDRIRLFEEAVAQIEEQGIVLANRVFAAEAAVERDVKHRAEMLLSKSRAYFQEIVRAQEHRSGSAWSEEETREAIAAAIPGFFEHELGTIRQVCEGELLEELSPQRRRAEELVASVHRLVAKLFDVPFESRPLEITLPNTDRPSWRTHKWEIRFEAIPAAWIDALFPRRFRNARLGRRLAAQAEYLVTRNVGNLRLSTLENLKRGVEEFGAALTNTLQQAIETTRDALVSAQQRRAETATTVAAEVERIQSALAEIQRHREQLTVACKQ